MNSSHSLSVHLARTYFQPEALARPGGHAESVQKALRKSMCTSLYNMAIWHHLYSLRPLSYGGEGFSVGNVIQ